MEFKEVTTKELCEELREHSALTFEGLIVNEESGYSLEKFITKHTRLLKNIAYVITGKDMNGWYKLTEGNAYQPNLTIVCIDLRDMEDAEKIIMPSKMIGARWLDDVIDNNLRRENEKALR